MLQERTNDSLIALPAIPTLFIDAALREIDQRIEQSAPIHYKAQLFSEHQVVEQFIDDHRRINSAMAGVLMPLYIDPFTCCIPAYGSRIFEPKIKDPRGAIEIARAVKARGETLDLLFVNEWSYPIVHEALADFSPETRVIVAIDGFSSGNASTLRTKGIPAIDDRDYERCWPLNALIALVVFEKNLCC